MADLNLEEESSNEPGAPLWVVTFGDMMSLLLTFFIMLLSFSEIDAIKYRAISNSIREAFGVQKLEEVFNSPKGQRMLSAQSGGTTGSILNELGSIIPRALPGATVAHNQGQGVLLTVPGHLLFELGKADLRPEMTGYLREIAEMMKRRTRVQLQVEGHTDNLPINTSQFRSNWELSAARAIAVVRFLIEEAGVPPERLGAAGYADSRPVAPNDTDENREKNRRVEFRFVEAAY